MQVERLGRCSFTYKTVGVCLLSALVKMHSHRVIITTTINDRFSRDCPDINSVLTCFCEYFCYAVVGTLDIDNVVARTSMEIGLLNSRIGNQTVCIHVRC